MFGHAEQKRHTSSATELEPLSRRLLQAAGALSLLLILVVANSLLNSGSESPFNPNPVAAAAERTQDVRGMHFTMEMRVTSEAHPPMTMTGSGAFNAETGLASVVYHAISPAGIPMDFQAVLDDDAFYFRYPQFAGKLPEGKEWIKVEGLPGQSDQSAMTAEGPDTSLQMLSATGAARRAGHVRIGKARTTRYRATLTATDIVNGLRAQGQDELADQFESVSSQLLGPVKAEAFIDRGGMLRRIRTATTALVDGTATTTYMRMDLFDFSAHPAIQVPDDSLVFELTPFLEEQLESFGEAS
jgi:hypothetical protein